MPRMKQPSTLPRPLPNGISLITKKGMICEPTYAGISDIDDSEQYWITVRGGTHPNGWKFPVGIVLDKPWAWHKLLEEGVRLNEKIEVRKRKRKVQPKQKVAARRRRVK